MLTCNSFYIIQVEEAFGVLQIATDDLLNCVKMTLDGALTNQINVNVQPFIIE